MTNSEIQPFIFSKDSVSTWAEGNPLAVNWPVVYTINSDKEIYVGETTNAELRMRQHLGSEAKKDLTHVNVIVDSSFNKSVCLDLESHLIRYFHADEKYAVLNGNGGITDADYFNRAEYRESFQEIFKSLVESGQLTRPIPELINSDFFKYSPFKALTSDQAIAIEEILETLLNSDSATPIVIQGDPGTGKTIVAVYLIKLLADIARSNGEDALDVDSLFVDFFQEGFREQIAAMKIGLVIPQISLRKTLQRVFKKTPGLDESMVLEPFDIGKSESTFDLLIIDEAHRLQQRNNQPAAKRNIMFGEINKEIFGSDDPRWTQLDWIKAKSLRQIYLLDPVQTVKPADLPQHLISDLVRTAMNENSYFKLESQMRINAGGDYVKYIGDVLNQRYSGEAKSFPNYDLRLFTNFGEMRKAIEEREKEHGLSRLVAGFAWPWVTKSGATHDIEIEGHKLAWNRRNYDWINSQTSVDEVGSIHTVQGYDLNYAGVIIGRDLVWDSETQQIKFNRESYFDTKGKENNGQLGIVYSDEDLRAFVINIYRVLLTRGVMGTYVYIVDYGLRDYLANFFAKIISTSAD